MAQAKIVTVFRSRLADGDLSDYGPMSQRMSELAVKMPGYISHKGYIAEDGERLTLVEFESEQAQNAWRNLPEHVGAQKEGRRRFYAEYTLQICQVLRQSVFTAKK